MGVTHERHEGELCPFYLGVTPSTIVPVLASTMTTLWPILPGAWLFPFTLMKVIPPSGFLGSSQPLLLMWISTEDDKKNINILFFKETCSTNQYYSTKIVNQLFILFHIFFGHILGFLVFFLISCNHSCFGNFSFYLLYDELYLAFTSPIFNFFNFLFITAMSNTVLVLTYFYIYI